ncbi:hypothetical protein Hanom_Chr02g00099941 [Helianthus anomalus]
MLKRIYVLNRPDMCSGSRPDRSNRPARSGFENLASQEKKILLCNIYMTTFTDVIVIFYINN